MTTFRSRQRGEGKVGCITALVVLGILGAAAVKLVPVLWGNNQLEDVCERKAESAAGREEEVLKKEILEEAQKIGVLEALKPRAIEVTKRGGGESNMGNCIVMMRYTTTVDFYGLYKYDVVVDKRISKPLLENIR
jgi:hypothetical protein